MAFFMKLHKMSPLCTYIYEGPGTSRTPMLHDRSQVSIIRHWNYFQAPVFSLCDCLLISTSI